MESNIYLNRELSWLEFNRRVLEEAQDENVPLLERVKFLAIFSSNLDEFFMVRVARLKRQIRDGIEGIGPDGLTAAEALTAISRRVHQLAEEQHLCFLNTILPQLTAEDIHLVRPEEMSREQERFLEEFFHRTLYPIVTPLAIDPGHPFPYLANRSLCLVVSLRATSVSRLPYADLSIVHIPSQVVPRFIALPAKEGQHAFMLLEDVLRHYLPRLYHGFELLSTHAIRVTRDADFGISRRRDETLLMSIEQGVREAAWEMRFVCNTIPSLQKKSWRNWWRNWNCHRRISIPARGSPLSLIFFSCQEKLYEIIQSEDGISAAAR